jgi:hypothetical protein
MMPAARGTTAADGDTERPGIMCTTAESTKGCLCMERDKIVWRQGLGTTNNNNSSNNNNQPGMTYLSKHASQCLVQIDDNAQHFINYISRLAYSSECQAIELL